MGGVTFKITGGFDCLLGGPLHVFLGVLACVLGAFAVVGSKRSYAFPDS